MNPRRYEYTTVDLRPSSDEAEDSEAGREINAKRREGWGIAWCDSRAGQVFMVFRREMVEVSK
jgi:hypothetical protein